MSAGQRSALKLKFSLAHLLHMCGADWGVAVLAKGGGKRGAANYSMLLLTLMVPHDFILFYFF